MRRFTYLLIALAFAWVANAQSITQSGQVYTVNGTVSVSSTIYTTAVASMQAGDTLYIGSSSDTLEINVTDSTLNDIDIVLMIIDGGVASWTSNVDFMLSDSSKLVMYNGGDLHGSTPCNANKRLIFGTFHLAACSGGKKQGGNAEYSFDEIELFGGYDPAYPPLPVSLTYFEGEKIHPGLALLQWQTATEINHYKFELYKSDDGREFSLIHTEYNNGPNSYSLKNYEHTNVYNKNTGAYYKLVQSDFDGTSETFNIVYIGPETGIAVSTFPNPTTDKVRVTVRNERMNNDLLLIAANGQIILDQNIESDVTETIDLTSYSSGTYFLLINGEKFPIIKN